MARHGIPTAEFQVCYQPAEAEELAASGRFGFPLVIKADGLAAGKGVFIVRDVEEARETIGKVMVDRIFGNAGDRVVLERFLQGEELSFMVISDGKQAVPLVTSQDHKAIHDGDKGPNTGGMGAYSPAVTALENPEQEVMATVIRPAIEGMLDEGMELRGVLYAGLMITENGIHVLEFNVRFGDPETQVVLPRMEGDLVPLLQGSARGQLVEDAVRWRREPAVCVVLASAGYPGSYKKGKVIEGAASFPSGDEAVLFHAGTAVKDKKLVTSGGRVLGVTALAPGLDQAIRRAYQLADGISFDGLYRRSDIGWRALERLGSRGTE
jgi:phosphoribosylamine--glycine ligase